MGFLHHAGDVNGEYITHFHAWHADNRVVLAWDLRHPEPREVMVLRSDKWFARRSQDPSDDSAQTLVYCGVERHIQFADAGLTHDVAYHYSVFTKGDDGTWRGELTTTVAPSGEAHLWRAGVDSEDELRATLAKPNVGFATLSSERLP